MPRKWSCTSTVLTDALPFSSQVAGSSRGPSRMGASAGRPPKKHTLPESGLPPRNVEALSRSIDHVVDVAGHLPPPGAPEEDFARWRRDLGTARLAGAREYSAIHHLLPMPPEQANQVHALLERGASLITETSSGTLPGSGRQNLLHLALLQGKHHNRCARHLGIPDSELPKLEYALASLRSDLVALTIANPDGVGTQAVRVWPAEKTHLGTIAHESVHVGQQSVATPPDPLAYRPTPPLFPATAAHPRGGMNEVAQGSPAFKARPAGRQDLGNDLAGQLARSAPREIQAHVEQAALLSLFPLRDASLSVEPIPPGSGMEQLGPLVYRAAKGVKQSTDILDAAVCLPPTTMKYAAEKGPRVGAAVEDILFATARLDDAMKSKAWTAQTSADLKSELKQLSSRLKKLQGKPIVDNTRQFEEIANVLCGFLEKLARKKGHAVHSPKGISSDANAFDMAKNHPLAVLEGVLARITAHAEPGQATYTKPERLAGELYRVKHESGFGARVLELKRSIAQGKPPTGKDVRDAVMQLAAPLLGLDPDAFPENLRPAVNLFDAPSMHLKHVHGLNLASHQKRKATFEAATWMLHVPRQLFDEPDKLEERLCGLAVDVAYPAAAVIAHDDPRKSDPAGGLVPAWSGQTLLDLTQDLYTYAKEHSDGFVRSHPDSAAAALRAVVEGTPVKDTDRIWHEGWRPAVKAAAADDSLDPRAREAALEAYQSKARQRWELPAVAFRRAVIAAQAPASEAQPPALRPLP